MIAQSCQNVSINICPFAFDSINADLLTKICLVLTLMTTSTLCLKESLLPLVGGMQNVASVPHNLMLSYFKRKHSATIN